METQKQMPGYVRSEVTHIDVEWRFEVMSEDPRVSLLTIETEDGPVNIGLNRYRATELERQLRLFLLDWPEDQAKS
jgi:hypothetical protein